MTLRPARRRARTVREAGALHNTVFGLLTQATTSVFTAGLTVYLGRALGEQGYGLFALALSIGGLALLASDAGLSYSAARFVAERHTDRGAAAGVASGALSLTLGAALIAAVLVWALAEPISAAYGEHGLVWPLRGVALAVVGQSVLLLFLRVFSALRRVRLGLGVVFLESLTEVTASVLLVALGAGATGAAFGRAIGYAAGAVAVVVVGVRALGPGMLALRPGGDVGRRDIARSAAPLFITNSVYTLYAEIDVLLIGAVLSTGAVGLFSGPMRFVIFLGYVGESVAGGIAPRAVRTPEHEPDVEGWTAGLRWLLVFQSLLVAPLLVWATPIMVLLLGQGFHASGPVLRALTLFVFLRGVSAVMSVTVNYLGKGARRVPIVVVALVVNAGLDLLLLPLIGPVGAAVGSGVAYLIYTLAHFHICRQAFTVPMRPLLHTLLRSALAAGLMAMVLLAFGTENVSVVEMIVGFLAGTLVYGVTLLATGEVRRDQLRHALALARRRFAAA